DALEHGAAEFPEPDRSTIARGGLFAMRVAELGERLEQAMHVAFSEPERVGQLGDTERTLGVRKRLQHGKALDERVVHKTPGCSKIQNDGTTLQNRLTRSRAPGQAGRARFAVARKVR